MLSNMICLLCDSRISTNMLTSTALSTSNMELGLKYIQVSVGFNKISPKIELYCGHASPIWLQNI